MLRTWAPRFVLAGILTHAAAYPTQADSFYDGSSLLNLCESKDTLEKWFCVGFVVGVADSFDCERPLMDGFHWQAPKGGTAGQIHKVVVRYLIEHPEKLHLQAASLSAAALSEAFPCP